MSTPSGSIRTQGENKIDKRVAVIAAIVVIVGLITMGSGMIARYMTRANACHQTRLMLFIAGLITALIIAALGGTYYKFVSEETQQKVMDYAWNEEEFRYTGSLGAEPKY